MACCQHHAHGALQIVCAERDHGRAHKALRQVHLDPSVHKDLGGRLGEELTGEAAIMAQHDVRVIGIIPFHPGRDGHAHASHIVHSEIRCDDGAPAIGTELDLGHDRKLLKGRN